jgi:hypothetical protein
MKLLTIAALLLTTTTTTSAATRYDVEDLHHGIKNHSIQTAHQVRTVEVNANMIRENQLKFAVKKGFPRATHIKVTCLVTSCYIKFVENRQPLLFPPKHVRIFFNDRGH